MGREPTRTELRPEEIRAFTKGLLTDLQALESMLLRELFETGKRRIGAEQELFLIDTGGRPAPVCTELLEELPDEEFTTELARFNLEINLPPIDFEPGCFVELEEQAAHRVGLVAETAKHHDADVLLTGILPTLIPSDAALENMTPRRRYRTLNDVLAQLSGGAYRLQIEGADELHFVHDSVMLEGCNTSFQVHLQVAPDEFAKLYNITQAITAPVLAACVNSPLLFGRRLWAETRIALFQQSIDTRRTTPHLREVTPRVRFGERWVDSSVLEVFREDIARIPALFAGESPADPFEELEAGRIPRLEALQLYNSTVYRWNRPCYGITGGKPHLRIECRVLPSGPTIVDEVANAAFWVGSVLGAVEEYGDVRERISFGDTRANFLAAARRGLSSGFTWLDGRIVSAPRIILDEVLPMARRGLAGAGIATAEIDKYLGIIESRVERRRTGAGWLRHSLEEMGDAGSRVERMAALAIGSLNRQISGAPCHEWDLAGIDEAGGWRYNYARVEQFMTTDLFTVKADELVDLAALVMEWKHVRQVPVEDEERRLVGLVSYGSVVRELAAAHTRQGDVWVPVSEIMDPDPVTVSPETSTLKTLRAMRENHVTSCPVVKNGRLVGIVSVDDLAPILDRMLEEADA